MGKITVLLISHDRPFVHEYSANISSFLANFYYKKCIKMGVVSIVSCRISWGLGP